MPIRINLLADQLAAEEARRNDPVKRAAFFGLIAVVLVLGWSAFCQLRVMNARNERDGIQARLQATERVSGQVKTNTQDLADRQARLDALYRLATNRHLWGNTLEALQMLNGNSNIHFTRLRAVQRFEITNAAPPVVKAEPAGAPAGKASKTGAAVATEHLTLIITAKDYGRPMDQNFIRFQETLANHPYFLGRLASNGVSMVEWTEPQPAADDPALTFTGFTLECRFAEKERRR